MCAALMQQNSFPQNGGVPNFTPAEFDYTFTDRELQDILGFMELQQTQGQSQEPPTSTPSFFPASSPASLGLQFQPHPPQGNPLGSAPVHAFDQKFVGSKGDAPSSSSAYGSGLGAPNGGLAAGHPATRSNSISQGPAPAPFPDKRPSLLQAQSFGTSGNKADRGTAHWNSTAAATKLVNKSSATKLSACDAAEPKQHISHSTVEKQRRDRINSLIDEVISTMHAFILCLPWQLRAEKVSVLLLQLRDLVPPQPLSSQQEGLENKRPKHVVLSDTIALVRDLQDKVCITGSVFSTSL